MSLSVPGTGLPAELSGEALGLRTQQRGATESGHVRAPRIHRSDNGKHEVNMSVNTSNELAAPLDLLLTRATRCFASRIMPNRTWARLGGNLGKQPGTVVNRGVQLTRELGSIAAGKSDRAPARSDKRFSDATWQQNPLLHRTMQAYLAASDTGDQLFADAHLDWRDEEKMRFVLDNFVDGLAPTNNPLISPLGWKALIDTGGLSAVRGARAFVRDMLSQPRVPTMVEPDAFAVGETVAITKGAVVLQTSMFELIQYTPQTPTVHSIPLLIVLPVINKYYIMDIAPGRSMIEYFVQQGQQVFVISWRNPQARHRDWGFDAYGGAIVEALNAMQKIAGTGSAHLLATCSGGILAAMVAAHLAEIGEGDRIAGLTLAVTVLDETRAGFAAAAMSDRAAQAAIRASAKKGYLDGRAMAEMFAWLRPTDLVWRYWVNNYVQGRSPAAFDVLFWNADTTRMTAALHRDMVLMGMHNSLVTPGAVSMLGTPVDLSKTPLRWTRRARRSGWRPRRRSRTRGGRTMCADSASVAALKSTHRKSLGPRTIRRWRLRPVAMSCRSRGRAS
jgi:polyhydroxyalkanoate synthase subunit PhaC